MPDWVEMKLECLAPRIVGPGMEWARQVSSEGFEGRSVGAQLRACPLAVGAPPQPALENVGMKR